MGTRCALISSSYTDWSSFLIPGLSAPVTETLVLGIIDFRNRTLQFDHKAEICLECPTATSMLSSTVARGPDKA